MCVDIGVTINIHSVSQCVHVGVYHCVSAQCGCNCTCQSVNKSVFVCGDISVSTGECLTVCIEVCMLVCITVSQY